MPRSRKKSDKVFSSVSDEQLAILIARDYDRAPEEFAFVRSCGMTDSHVFLHKTSARGIEPMKKWL